MVWYAMLWYPMLWYGMESMVCYEISMLCYEISMLCYAVVYVVKDKHSATVIKEIKLIGNRKKYNQYNYQFFNSSRFVYIDPPNLARHS